MHYVGKIAAGNLWRYVGNTWFFLLGLVCVGYFAANLQKEKNRQHLVLYTGGIVFLYVWPPSGLLIMDYCLSQGIYWRMFWLFPLIPVTAVVLAEIVGKMLKPLSKIAAAVAVTALLIWAGDFVYTQEMYDKAPNGYKLPADVFPVCDMLESHADGNPIRVVVPNKLVPYMRQYNAGITMPYGRQVVYWQKEHRTEEALALFYEMNNPEKTAESLSALAAENLCNYLVLEKADPLNNAMTDCIYQPVADAGNYMIYFRNAE